jgi:hypothetical protein
MPQPEADYAIEIDENEMSPADQLALRQLREDQALRDERDRVDRELAQVQARAAETADPSAEIAQGVVVDTGDTIEMMGRKFRVADKVGLMPLLKFASASEMRTSDPRALSAIYSMLKNCIYEGVPGCGACATCRAGDEENCKSYDPGDWGEFERHAIDAKAEADDLMPVVSQVMEIISGRPTELPAGSSAGRRGTRGASTASTSGARGRASRH